MNRPYEVDSLMRSLSNCAENIFLKKWLTFVNLCGMIGLQKSTDFFLKNEKEEQIWQFV